MKVAWHKVVSIVSWASPSYSKRERGSGEQSQSACPAHGTIERDVVDHKIRIYMARLCSSSAGVHHMNVSQASDVHNPDPLGSKDGNSKQFLLSLPCRYIS